VSAHVELQLSPLKSTGSLCPFLLLSMVVNWWVAT